jgi:hypothetical protein
MQQYRALILRSNRFLGSALVEKNLITTEYLEAANEKLLECLQNGDFKRASLLKILLYEMECLDEEAIIEYQVENYSLGLVDLTNYTLAKLVDMGVDYEACLATWSLPYDKVENFYLVATAYYLSQPVIKFWEEQLKGPVIWYCCSLGCITSAFDWLEGANAEPVEKIEVKSE